jgi:WD40 repeat protein
MAPFIYIWDAQTGKGLHQFIQPELALSPMIAFTADSKYFGGYHSIWDLKTGEEVLKLDGDFRAFSDEGPRVASLHERGIQIWDLANRKKLRNFPGSFLALSKDGKRLTTLVENQAVVWNVESGKEVVKIAGKFMNHFAGQIIACSNDKDLRLWDTATGKELAKLPTPFDLGDRFRIPRHAFSPDGKKFRRLPSE